MLYSFISKFRTGQDGSRIDPVTGL